MPTHTRHITASELGNDIVLSWSVHLARENPARLLFSLGMIALASAAGYYVIGPVGAVATAVAIAASIADFLFPMNYVLTADGAECGMLFKKSEIRWENVKHCYLDGGGIKLSPLDRRSKLEAFRGVYLKFQGNEEQVTNAVRSLRRT